MLNKKKIKEIYKTELSLIKKHIKNEYFYNFIL